MRAYEIAGALALLAACGSTAPSSPSASASASPSASGSASPSASASASGSASPSASPYELHEWGVIDVPSNGSTEIAAGAGQPQRPMSVRKPVVYVHLLDGASEVTFGLRVALRTGTFVEHDPAGTIAGTTLEWPSIVARAAHCATSARYARRAAPACSTIDGVCEVDELPRYDAPSSACLDVGGVQTGLLFYRGQAPSVPLPLAASRASDLSVTVTASASLAGAPGGLIRLSTALSGPWPMGRIVVSRAPLPVSGGSVSLPVGTEAITREQGMAELRTSLIALGLTDDEASAFLAGWGGELFGADVSARGTVGDLPVGPRHQDVLIYFLPAASVDAIAALTATPTPRAIRRAFMVRIDLGAVTTA